jgi:D-serine deaminase-like pyridoxal phosphate-dependent protein
MQIEFGAQGLTTAKVGEAEVMAAAADDLLVAYPAFDPHRRERIARLARERTIRVAVDSPEAVDALAHAARALDAIVGLLVDVDVGLHRTGIDAPDDALTLAQRIDRTSGVRLDGIMIYPGHIWAPPTEQAPQLALVADKLANVLDTWSRSGLAAAVVSGGSTPTMRQSHLIPQITEIRPGTYVFNDTNTVRGRYCDVDDCAARIICTVVSSAVRGQVVVDAGSKMLTSDRCTPVPDSGHGFVVEYPEAKVVRLSEEHAQIDVTACPSPPQIGRRLTVIPNHICPCINLHDQVWWLEDGVPQPLPIEARGKVS